MPDDLKTGSTADAPSAEGDGDVVDTGSLPDELRDEILAGFHDGIVDDDVDDDGGGGPTGEADGEADDAGGDDERSAGDGGAGTEDDGDAGDGSGDGDGDGTDDPEEQELDRAEQSMGRKQRRAFAGLRTKLKDARQQLEESQEHATFGKAIQGALEESGATPEDFKAAIGLIAQRRSDPLRALKGLQAMLNETAESARGEYPEQAVAAILGAGADGGAAGDAGGETPLEELDEGLAQAVDYGLMTEEHARELLAQREKGAKPKKPDGAGDDNGGGDDDGDQIRVADQEQLITDLQEMGYYDGLTTPEQYTKRVEDELIPRAIDIAEELEVDIRDPQRLQRILVRAAKELTAERSKKDGQGTRRRKPPVSQRRSTAPTRKPSNEVPADDGEFKRAVLQGFS
jgi:hypothetical protein